MRTVVVYVHGLWLTGVEAVLLRRRLERSLGAHSQAFSYASVHATLSENALSLRRHLAATPADRLHLIAHSLGGLVVLRLFEDAIDLPPGRVVLMGSPVRGCLSARRFSRMPFRLGSRALGLSGGEGLIAPRERQWRGSRELGVIAGNRAAGLGRLLGPMPAANDGTVLVEETRLPGATETRILPVSHSGMVFSATVARQAAAFLANGRFDVESKESSA